MSTSISDQNRLHALQRYQILDTPPDGSFDKITALVAQLLNVPVAIVSLVDTDRIWFKSHYGTDVEEIEREPGLCASAILGDLPYILNDASIDPRALSNPLVAGQFGLRFYAGVPLKTQDNYNLGVLCAIDFEPRDITPEELTILETLADIVMDEMELRLSARKEEENKRAQEYLNRLDKLKLAGQLAAGVAHELRNPLTVIKGFVNLLNKANHFNHDGYMKIIVDEVHNIEETLDEFLLLSKQQVKQWGERDIEKIVQNAQSILRREQATQDIQILLMVQKNLPTVFCDESALQHVFLNVMKNAMESMPYGGTVSVECARFEGENVIVRVTDSGCGIPAERLKSLGEPFYSTKDKGTGMGLMVAYNILEQHKGSMSIQSQLGHGTVVDIVLPPSVEMSC